MQKGKGLKGPMRQKRGQSTALIQVILGINVKSAVTNEELEGILSPQLQERDFSQRKHKDLISKCIKTCQA